VTEDPLGEDARPLSVEEADELLRMLRDALAEDRLPYDNITLVKAFLTKG
jgi:hypothetical protein